MDACFEKENGLMAENMKDEAKVVSEEPKTSFTNVDHLQRMMQLKKVREGSWDSDDTSLECELVRLSKQVQLGQ